jgi:hypothetical protein
MSVPVEIEPGIWRWECDECDDYAQGNDVGGVAFVADQHALYHSRPQAPTAP